MRIASLVPSSTEMLFALGLGERVVAVTHECDYPPEVRSIPHLTSTVLPPDIAPGDIDAAVKAVVGEGRALYELDEERLAEVGPDLIVTQAVCDVCAVSYDDVLEVAERLPGDPFVLQQDPSTLGEVLEDVIRLGEATGMQPEAGELRADLEGRLATQGKLQPMRLLYACSFSSGACETKTTVEARARRCGIRPSTASAIEELTGQPAW